jgi:hypothetical protein
MILNENAGTHDIYLPKKRARRTVAPLYQPPDVEANPNGSHEQRQAWMRQKQALGQTGKRLHVTALVNPPGPQSKIFRHPNSIIIKLAEQLRAKGVL